MAELGCYHFNAIGDEPDDYDRLRDAPEGMKPVDQHTLDLRPRSAIVLDWFMASSYTDFQAWVLNELPLWEAGELSLDRNSNVFYYRHGANLQCTPGEAQ